MNEQEILERMRKARKAAGLSQRQAARLIGMSNSGLCDIEAGRNPLYMSRFLELCRIYGVSPVWVITGVNPDFNPQPFIEAIGKGKKGLQDVLDIFEMLG